MKDGRAIEGRKINEGARAAAVMVAAVVVLAMMVAIPDTRWALRCSWTERFPRWRHA
jgi:hypothetical protein